MIDFPASPTNGQVFTSGAQSWTWDGTKWVASGNAVMPPLSTGDNRIVNGDMRIDQRGVASGAGGAANGYTIDRWSYTGTVASKGTWARNLNATSLPQFPYSLGFVSSSAYAPLAGDTFYFAQPIEADAISDFWWGSASAQSVTLSFWVTSSLTGTFSGAITNYGSGGVSTRAYCFTYSIPVASVWTKIVITIPGDTTGTGWLMSGNGVGAYLRFDLGGSSTYRAAAGWQSGNFVGVTGSVNAVATNGATFFVTGVKLEIGSVATPFNRQSLAKSQADCERYFRWLPFSMNFNAAAASQVMQVGLSFPAMRAAPTTSAVAADPNTTQTAANNAANSISPQSPYSAVVNLTSTTTGACTLTGYRVSASAEL